MAAANQLRSLKEEATCSICLECFTDPVSVECGHAFCLSCISQYWEGMQADFPCPQCRKISTSKTFRPNRQLANMVEIAKQLQVPSATPQEANLCSEHEEKLKLFCKDDQEPICLVCSMSRDHKTHKMLPIREAAQEHKETFQSYLHHLKKKLEDMLNLHRKEEMKVKQLEARFKRQSEQVTYEFEKLQRFLEKEQSRHLKYLEEEEKKSLQRIKETLTKSEDQQSVLRSMIAEIESRCQQQDVELLKNVNYVLKRFKNMKAQQMAYDTFKEKEEETEEEKEEDLQILIIQALEWRWARSFAAEVTLDPDTANEWLIVSEDGSSVRRGVRPQGLPNMPQRFNPVGAILGRQRLSSGTHYWEVEVGDKTEWSLGVCDEAVSRKGVIIATPKYGYWAIRLREGTYEVLSSTILTPRVPPRAVGLFLDYEAGKLSVYNVNDRSLLFTFSGASFPPTLRPYFNPRLNNEGENAGALRILPLTGQE